MSRIRTTKWNMFFFYLRTVIGFVNGILIVPLYLKYIDNALFGVWLASGNILTWITVIDPGVGDVLVQKVSAAISKNNKKNIEYILSSAVVISSIVTSAAFIISFGLGFLIQDILKVSEGIPMQELLFAYKVNAVATCVSLFSFCLSGSIVGFQKTKEVGVILTVTSLLGLILNVVLLVNGYGLASIAYSSLFKSVSACLVYAIFLNMLLKDQNIKFNLNKRYFRSFLKLFSYTFFSKFFATLAANVDLVVISRYLGPNAVMVLELTRRPIRVLQGFVNIPSQSLLPAFSNLYAERDQSKISMIFRRYITIFSFTLLLMVSGFIVFNKEVITVWVGDKFYIGDFNNLLLCLSVLTGTFAYNLSNFTYSMGNIKGNSKLEAVKGFMYLVLLILFTKLFGITGALLAIVLSSVSTETWYYPLVILKRVRLQSEELTSMKRSMRRGFSIAFVLIFLFYFFAVNSWYWIGVKGVLFVAVYSIVFYWFDMSIREEFKTAKKFVLDKIRR